MIRRDFLKLAAATVAGISLGGGRFTKLIPFMSPSPQVLPGVATWYATSCRECPAGCGMLARNREARATKAEGNPLHPINAGALCSRGQAAVQGLYDPDRIRSPQRRAAGGRTSHPVTWRHALQELGQALASARSRQGRASGRVAVISDLQAGSLEALIRDWLKAFGSERYLIYEPFNYEPLREANRLVFGRDAIPDYRLHECDFVLSLAADFTETWISPVKWIRRFADTRAPETARMSKFVYAGPRASLTSFSADESFILAPGEERWLGLAVLNVMLREGLRKHPLPGLDRLVAGFAPEQVGRRLGVSSERISRLARGFGRASSPVALAGAVMAGGRAAVESAVVANLLNWVSGAGRGRFTNRPYIDFGRAHALGGAATASQIAEFVAALGQGEVEVLVIIGANPAYSLPSGHRFAEALKQVPTVVSLSSFPDETAQLASWLLPTSTPLESWGDYEPEAGIANLMQPAMGRRHGSRMAGDILLGLARAAGAVLAGDAVPVGAHLPRGGGRGRAVREPPLLHPGATVTEGNRSALTYYGYLRRRWAKRAAEAAPGKTAEVFWQESLARGGDWGAERPVVELPRPRLTGVEFSTADRPSSSGANSLALWPYPSTTLFDGRGANRRWLQEMPDVVTHAVWMSWLEIHPETAAELGIKRGDVLEVQSGAGRIQAPAFIYPGVARGTLAIPFGQGHISQGRYAAKRGANAFRLVESNPTGEPPFPEVRISRRLGREPVVTTDGGVTQEGRGLFEAVTLSQLRERHPGPIIWPLPQGYELDRDLYPPVRYHKHRWAMAIDASRCVGCGACVVACYAENNVAVVGKRLMAQGREMAWIWVDRYYQWESPHTPALMLPVLCQHCDAAPCEAVCPVFASSHTEEGLNAQIYNRCIGTRYCSHNCPYKVRRFNWRNYDWPEPLTWQLNPDVTVRSRGVMEKCTFCIQRIKEHEQLALTEGRPLRDGEITPACAQTCPAQVFTFGDLLDRESRISKLVRQHPRRFQLLQQLNTKPAVIYLQKVINDTEPA